jgi:hypothetical protein
LPTDCGDFAGCGDIGIEKDPGSLGFARDDTKIEKTQKIGMTQNFQMTDKSNHTTDRQKEWIPES